MSSLKIRKIGNSLGVILPKEIQDLLEVVEGDLIEFTRIDHKKVLLESSLPHHSQWKFRGVSDLTKEDQDWLDADLEDDTNVQKW